MTTDQQSAQALAPTNRSPILHYSTDDLHTALCGAKLKGVDVPDASATCSVCLELHELGITRVDLLLGEIERKLESLRG